MRLWRSVTLAVFTLAGALFVTSGLNSHGLDLRGSSITDLNTVVGHQRKETDSLRSQVAVLTSQVDSLTKQVKDTRVTALQHQLGILKGPAGLQAVSGPGVSVVLNDAPASEIAKVQQAGQVPIDRLLVHQQDIQAVVNALWAGGAEAMSVQGQRVMSTTGIKCVGNTVVLHGVPYSPPYVIEAIGNPARLARSLDTSAYIAAYKIFVTDFQLGYFQRIRSDLALAGYHGSLGLQYARPAKAVAPSRN
ncbi:MAG: DUF881 domain-containing protein [Actinomycetota bacterium]|nr:DUF881 domain-containing protein [Actinomycetota bacterium]